MVRTSQAEQSLIPTVADAIRGVDSRITISSQTTMTAESQQRADSLLAPFVNVACWRFRGGGVAARSCWTLRSDCLFGKSTYSRDWSSHRAGRTTQYVYRLILKEAGVLALAGIVIGTGCAIHRCLADAQTSLWHSAVGRHDACLRGGCVRCICITGELPSGTTRRVSRSDYGACALSRAMQNVL